MSATPIVLSPTRSDAATAARSGCPLGAYCTCVFQKVEPVDTASVETPTAPLGEALQAEVTNLTDWGWHVVSAHPSEVALERRRGLGFCPNVLLAMATGFVWLIVWVPRARRPLFESVTLTTDAAGAVTTSPVTRTRRAR